MAIPTSESSQIRRGITLVALLIIVFLCDWQTGYEISVGPLYLMVVVYASWHFGVRGGFCVSFIAAMLWLVTDVGTGKRYSQAWIIWQQFGVRLVIYLAITYSISHYRRTLEAHRRRLAVLERVLIVCPACGRIAPREGGWMHAEEFIQQSGERYKFCPSCVSVSHPHAAAHPARPQLS